MNYIVVSEGIKLIEEGNKSVEESIWRCSKTEFWNLCLRENFCKLVVYRLEVLVRNWYGLILFVFRDRGEKFLLGVII